MARYVADFEGQLSADEPHRRAHDENSREISEHVFHNIFLGQVDNERHGEQRVKGPAPTPLDHFLIEPVLVIGKEIVAQINATGN